ncbi:MAG TPA: DUF4097 family beta strand repeat-containing protein [Terriglobales bacterium]|nr:DUF4097 family beta strand repeat-containing protein [Terriglobales bacterium]
MRILRATLLLAGLLLPTLLWAAPADTSSSTDNPFHWTGKLQPDQWVRIKNVSGDIRAEGVAGDQVEITATKSGPDADQVRIEVVQDSDGVTLCAVYPSGWGEENHCASGHGWHNSTRGNFHARVDFTVRLPRNLLFDAQTVSGKVEAEHLGRRALVSSVNGAVQVSTAEWAEATTVNGSITARFGSSDWPDALKLASVNGAIDLEVPADFSAEVSFSSVNGRFETDFPLTVQGGVSRFHLTGTIGSGGRRLKLETVNGSVTLHKRAMN